MDVLIYDNFSELILPFSSSHPIFPVCSVDNAPGTDSHG